SLPASRPRAPRVARLTVKSAVITILAASSSERAHAPSGMIMDPASFHLGGGPPMYPLGNISLADVRTSSTLPSTYTRGLVLIQISPSRGLAGSVMIWIVPDPVLVTSILFVLAVASAAVGCADSTVELTARQ